MSTYNFEVVKTRRQKALPCPSCGRKVRRSRIFENTINPYNRNAEGHIKEYREVLSDVRAEGDAWAAQAEVCSTCSKGSSE